MVGGDRLAALLAALLLGTAGCTATDAGSDAPQPDRPSSPAPTPSPAETTGQTTGQTTASAEPSPRTSGTPTPSPPPHRVSVAALIQTKFTGKGLRVGRVLAEAGAYTRYAVRYRSQGLRVSGIMNVPAGRGPFPVLILNHGYIDPDVYVTGQGLAREQDWLARRGYVVLHTDYRNHASSDNDPNVDYELRLPYAVDVVNAVRAVKRSGLPYLDGERVGLLGRSMGGS